MTTIRITRILSGKCSRLLIKERIEKKIMSVDEIVIKYFETLIFSTCNKIDKKIFKIMFSLGGVFTPLIPCAALSNNIPDNILRFFYSYKVNKYIHPNEALKVMGMNIEFVYPSITILTWNDFLNYLKFNDLKIAAKYLPSKETIEAFKTMNVDINFHKRKKNIKLIPKIK